jgi:hypothetical protein
MNNQRGLSLVGFVLVAALAAFAALIAFKTVPAIVEYFTIKKNINAIVKSGDARGASVSDIRKAYDRRASVDDTPSLSGADLDIGKEQGQVVISFAYSRKVNLFGNVSLCFDFEGATTPQAGGEVP